MEDLFPQPPHFTEAEIEECRVAGDYSPIFFEWYKYTAWVAQSIASIEMRSPAARSVKSTHYGVLVGLLNRCSRLMLANVALSHKEGLFGETTALIDRCIFESCVKIQWLCTQNSDDAFGRFLADGLKAEIALKREVEKRIDDRSGAVFPIERRMLDSISRCLSRSELSESEVVSAKKLPDLATMVDDIGHDRLTYVVGQKIGSHHVHGNWPSLLVHYLELDEDGAFHPRDHNVPTQVDQYVMISLMVIEASKAFVAWLLDSPEAADLVDLLESQKDELVSVHHEVVGDDFSLEDQSQP